MERGNVDDSSNYFRRMKHLYQNGASFQWTSIYAMVPSHVRTNKIQKFIAFFAIVFVLCFIVNVFFDFLSTAEKSGHPKGGATRHRSSTENRLAEKTDVQQRKPEQERVGFMPSADFHRKQQRQRRQLVQSVCKENKSFDQLLQKNKIIKPSHFSNIFFDDTRRFLYCSVPKIACTNWKRILLLLTGKMNTTRLEDLNRWDVHRGLQATYLRPLSNYTIDEIIYRIMTYFKFMFVREPFERILSAYHNKFGTNYNHYFKRMYGRHIVKSYRTNPTNESLHGGNDVTFEEFVAYLLDPKTTRKGRSFEPHWRPFYQLCHPCLVRYDVIGKYETIMEDADWTLSELGVREIVRFPTANPRRVKTSDLLAHKFANISAADIHRLWNLYSADFQMFGYPYPRFLTQRIAKSTSGSL